MPSRKRIGLLVPSVNAVLEPDFASVIPPAVTLHSQRLWAPPRAFGSGEESDLQAHLGRMNQDIELGVKYLMTAAVDVLVYGCTSGSFYEGVGGEKQIAEDIARISGLPTVVTTGALLQALRAFGVRRLTVVSPYNQTRNRALREFLVASGYKVLAVNVDPRASAGSRAIADEEPDEILEFASRNCAPGSELIVCPCTAWRSFEIVDELERRLGIPAVTANQATIWATLSELGMSAAPSRHGALFGKPRVPLNSSDSK